VATMKSASLRCLKARLRERICDGESKLETRRAGGVQSGCLAVEKWRSAGVAMCWFSSQFRCGGRLAFAARALKTVAVGRLAIRFVRLSRDTVWMYSGLISQGIDPYSRSNSAGGAWWVTRVSSPVRSIVLAGATPSAIPAARLRPIVRSSRSSIAPADICLRAFGAPTQPARTRRMRGIALLERRRLRRASRAGLPSSKCVPPS
jgi:hypothetical protein